MKQFCIAFLAAILFACQAPKSSVDELFQADREFSSTAEKIGFNKAFIEYAHDDAVLLRENSMPVVGKTAITKLYENKNAKGVIFTWEPVGGDIAESGELGYTYGTYVLKMDTIVQKGTYVSVWKKNKNGEWKYILDTGNEGLGQ